MLNTHTVPIQKTLVASHKCHLNSSGHCKCKYVSYLYVVRSGPSVIQFLSSMNAIVALKVFTACKCHICRVSPQYEYEHDA